MSTLPTPTTPTPAAADSLAARVERHLLHTVGVAPADAGKVDLMFDNALPALPYVRAHKVEALAVAASLALTFGDMALMREATSTIRRGSASLGRVISPTISLMCFSSLRSTTGLPAG